MRKPEVNTVVLDWSSRFSVNSKGISKGQRCQQQSSPGQNWDNLNIKIVTTMGYELLNVIEINKSINNQWKV